MIELKKGRSLFSHGVTLSPDADTTIKLEQSTIGLDNNYFAVVNDSQDSFQIAFGGIGDNDEPIYPDDYFTIHANGNYEIPPAAFSMNIKVWLRGSGRVVLIY